MEKILVFIYDNMSDYEITLACHLARKELVIIAYEKKIITAYSGMTYYPQKTVKEALEELDDQVIGIIIPGGANKEFREELNELLNTLNDRKQLIAAICAGPQYLARAHILADRTYTTGLTPELNKLCFPNTEYPFKEGNLIQANVVKDGNIITAIGKAFVDFALEISEYLGNIDTQEDKQELAKEYKGIIYLNEKIK